MSKGLEDVFTDPVDVWKAGWESSSNPCNGDLAELAEAFSVVPSPNILSGVKILLAGAAFNLEKIGEAAGGTLPGWAKVAKVGTGLVIVPATGVDLGCKLGSFLYSLT